MRERERERWKVIYCGWMTDCLFEFDMSWRLVVEDISRFLGGERWSL